MKHEILNLINRNAFVDIKDCGNNVLKFYNSSGQGNLSAIYIDYANTNLDRPEELLQKHKRIIEADYFQTKGSLQWNFYYYFVFDNETYSKLKDSKQVHDIETNTSYSRKRVLNLELLENSYPFSLSLKKINESKVSYSDLSSEWIKVLRENDLDEVYSEDKGATFAAAVERYLNGNPIKEDEGTEESTSRTEVTSPSKIKELRLKRFRSFPDNQTYRFGSVNLIEGANGKGKTSLLESIELLMCGKTYRHESLGVEKADISLTYKDTNTVEEFEPKKIKKFQEREQFWYGIPHTPKRNNLFKSFNRFNFFNTDASYRFSAGEEPKVIWNSFQSLALGGKTSEMSKRLEGFSSRFEENARRIHKELEQLDLEITDLLKSKAAIESQPKNQLFSIDKANAELEKAGLNLRMENGDEEHIASLQKQIRAIANRIKAVESVFPEESDISIEKAAQLQKESQITQSDISTIFENLNTLETQKRQKTEAYQQSEKLWFAIKRLEQYSSHDIALDLPKLEADIQKTSILVARKKGAVTTIANTDLLETTIDDSSIVEIIKNYEQQIPKLKLEMDQIESKVKLSKESIENLKAILLEIKSLGRRFLAFSSSSSCPLCDTNFSRQELETKIGKIEISADDYAKLIEERASLELHQRMLTDALDSLKRMYKSVEKIDDSNELVAATIRKVKSTLKKELDAINELSNSYEIESKKLKTLQDQGYSVEELNSLLIGVGLIGSPNKSMCRTQISEAAKAHLETHSKLYEELKNIDIHINKLKTDFYRKYPQYGAFDFSSQKKKAVFEELLNIQNSEEDLSTLSKSFALSAKTEALRNQYRHTLLLSEDLQNHLSFLGKLKQETLNLQQLSTQIEGKQRERATLELTGGRANRAVEAFNKISQEFGVESAVNKFFSQNKAIILEIFKAIHTPNEFEDIILSDESIFVVKKGVQRELSTISTGQRTAVALSIFLGMHLSCPMAPKLILLDDPIAFVDDLNVLAVLDFLREIVVKGDRQLFFATANRKLADLFKRKFDLLGSDFVTLAPNCNSYFLESNITEAG